MAGHVDVVVGVWLMMLPCNTVVVFGTVPVAVPMFPRPSRADCVVVVVVVVSGKFVATVVETVVVVVAAVAAQVACGSFFIADGN